MMCVCKMTRGHGLGEPSSLSAPLPGLNLSLSDPNQPLLSPLLQIQEIINETTQLTSATESSWQSAALSLLSQDSLLARSLSLSLYKSE